MRSSRALSGCAAALARDALATKEWRCTRLGPQSPRHTPRDNTPPCPAVRRPEGSSVTSVALQRAHHVAREAVAVASADQRNAQNRAGDEEREEGDEHLDRHRGLVGLQQDRLRMKRVEQIAAER